MPNIRWRLLTALAILIAGISLSGCAVSFTPARVKFNAAEEKVVKIKNNRNVGVTWLDALLVNMGGSKFLFGAVDTCPNAGEEFAAKAVCELGVDVKEFEEEKRGYLEVEVEFGGKHHKYAAPLET